MIEVKNLSKNYGPVPAVKGISFTVKKGAIYGFLGPNGAGKSTTLNMICGCLAATAGEISVCGHDIIDEPIEAKSCIGYLPEIPPLYMDMTPFEYLEFVGLAKGLRKNELYDEIEYVMEKAKISDVADRLIKNLSKGYRQRVGIAQALMGDPEIIILDEPTVGLDPIQIAEIRSLITELSEEHIVILSSHILQEIEAVCTHVIMISKGNIVADESLAALTENETLEQSFIRLAGESLDAGAAYAAQKAEEKEEKKLSKKGKKKIIVDSDKGGAYYEEIFVDEEPEEDPEIFGDDIDEDFNEDIDEDFDNDVEEEEDDE